MAIYDDSLTVFDMWGPHWIYEGASSWKGMAEQW
jgi:hypothetical protein